METVPKGVYARVPEAIAVADGDGVLRWAAAAFVKLTGTRLDALIGASCRALLHPEDEDLFERIAASPTE